MVMQSASQFALNHPGAAADIKLSAIHGSDIRHFDVIDTRDPPREACEPVEDGHATSPSPTPCACAARKTRASSRASSSPRQAPQYLTRRRCAPPPIRSVKLRLSRVAHKRYATRQARD